jgi:ribonuclease I
LNSLNIDCFNGPDFWCLNETTESLCNFTNKTIGICGYSNKRCEIKTGKKIFFLFYFFNGKYFLGDRFCKSSPPVQQQSPFDFNGGLTGVDDDLFFYYSLSLYWPPSSCPSKYNETIDFLRFFCSPYTDINQPGSERLVLHGLWPTFSTKGNYQGWPQFCSSKWSKCHIDGNLCPWKNITKDSFTQTDYEYCLSVENIQECLINPTDILLPEEERLKVLAPGYLGPRNLFINHEWTKHGK